jgi:hypothetical protein
MEARNPGLPRELVGEIPAGTAADVNETLVAEVAAQRLVIRRSAKGG